MKVLQKNQTANHSFFSSNVLHKFFLTAFVAVCLSAGIFFVPVYAHACETVVKGCTDSLASNYNSHATQDDGSCTYARPTCPFQAQDGRIIVNFDGSKLYDQTGHTIAGPVDASISAGTYTVSLFSYDGYSNRATTATGQDNERWYASLKNGTTEVAQSSAIDDLADGVNFATKNQVVDQALVVSQNVDSVSAMSVPSGDSVYPVCAAFDKLSAPEPQSIKVVAAKVTCDSETDLPDWGKGPSGGPSMDFSTAVDYISTHPTCSLTPEWGFQWAPGDASNPGDNTGEASAPWTTFGPTDENGVASTTIEESQLNSTGKIWMREIMQTDYVNFFGVSNDGTVRESAEMYCYNDVLNYDNYDYINNPQPGETYYCVAFNALKEDDNTPPVITLVGDNPLLLTVGDTYTDPGATATDTEDGDITGDIVVGGDTVDTSATSTFTVTYNVTDSDGAAAAEVTRDVVVSEQNASNTPPVITLVGDNPLLLTVGDTYTDPGATATDTEDGDITGDIVVGGDTVDTSATSTFTVTYNVTDSDGAAAAEVTRDVVVSEVPPVNPIPGCTNSGASNYNPDATVDDGSCQYPGPAPVPGCTDPSASNYNPGATWNDDSCQYPGPAPNPGCTDPDATNYNPSATWNDDSCQYPGPAPVYQCSDGIDNDGDNLIDANDPGCHTDEDTGNTDSYDPNDNDETNPATPPAQCNYLLEYLKLGADNNPVEVTKLQFFLKNYEGFENLQVTGFFDQATFDAVSEFQNKYKDDVLTPWGHNAPTGYVYITTKKKVNEIYCQRPFPLTSSQETEITDFKALLESLQQQNTPEEIENQNPGFFEQIGQAPSNEGGQSESSLAESNEGNSASTSLAAGVDLADLQLLAKAGQQNQQEANNNGGIRGGLLAALNFVGNNKLVAALIALAVFFFFSIYMIWKKTKPENPTYV